MILVRGIRGGDGEMRRVRNAGHLIDAVHRRAGSEIDVHAVASHQTMRPGGADDDVGSGLRVAADGQFRQQATARALDQIRGRDREMIAVNHAGDLKQAVGCAAGGEDEINRIADGEAVAGKGGGDDAIGLAVSADQKLRRGDGERRRAGQPSRYNLARSARRCRKCR